MDIQNNLTLLDLFNKFYPSPLTEHVSYTCSVNGAHVIELTQNTLHCLAYPQFHKSHFKLTQNISMSQFNSKIFSHPYITPIHGNFT